jgi:hypothetical protein
MELSVQHGLRNSGYEKSKIFGQNHPFAKFPPNPGLSSSEKRPQTVLLLLNVYRCLSYLIKPKLSDFPRSKKKNNKISKFQNPNF